MSRTHTAQPMTVFTKGRRSRPHGRSGPGRRAARTVTIAMLALASLGAISAGPAQARPEPAPGWSAQSPYGGAATVHCDKYTRTVQGSLNRDRGVNNGYARARMCLAYFRNTSGTYYYQGVLSLTYIENVRGATDVFGGRSMSVLQGNRYATGVRDCGRITWRNGQTRYCYSPTVTFRGRGRVLYAKGYVFDPAGNWHPMWSQTLPTT